MCISNCLRNVTLQCVWIGIQMRPFHWHCLIRILRLSPTFPCIFLNIFSLAYKFGLQFVVVAVVVVEETELVIYREWPIVWISLITLPSWGLKCSSVLCISYKFAAESQDFIRFRSEFFFVWQHHFKCREVFFQQQQCFLLFFLPLLNSWPIFPLLGICSFHSGFFAFAI